MLIAQRVWRAKALLTPALALNAHHVMVNLWSTAIGRPALHAVPVLVPMSSRQIASSVWKDGIQHSECASSALSRMSSLLTELAVWPLRCAQRAHNVQIQPVVTIKMTARPALLAPSVHLEDCVTRAVRLARLQTRSKRSAKRVCPAVRLLQIARAASNVMALLTPASVWTALTVVRRMSSTLRRRHAPHVRQEPDRTLIEHSASAALVRPSQPSANAKIVWSRMSSVMITRRVGHAHQVNSRMQIAPHVWIALALHTLSLEFSVSNVMTWLVQAPRAASLAVRERVPTMTTPYASHERAQYNVGF